MDSSQQDAFTQVLLTDIVPATGCTEPIAIALAAAMACETLGKRPESLDLRCSGNIIKNARAVTVPRSGGRIGIEIAAALGALAGKAAEQLRCLEGATESDAQAAAEFVEAGHVNVSLEEGISGLWIDVTAHAAGEQASVRLEGIHTYVARHTHNDQMLLDAPFEAGEKAEVPEDLFSLERILEFADSVNFDERPKLADLLDRQVAANEIIADEGLRGGWGAEIGKTLQETRMQEVHIQARALAAAGSDARMSGCALPVMINSGSGNQGLTVSMPVLTYARELGSSHDELRRALIVSNLVAIYQKKLAGRLSAFCGVVSAASGAAAGIARLKGLNHEQVGMAVVNTIATSGGMVCDGAKPSCASKISVAVENATCGVDLAERDKTFRPGQGLVGKDHEETIRNIGRIAHDGMAETDIQILHTMLGQ